MDSVSQIVLGAAVGEAVLGKKAGNKAAMWGAICGTIPDLDVVANLFLGQFDATAAHRGFSHSILFCVLVAPAIGWGIRKLYDIELGTQQNWTWLAFWALFTHPLLDCFTTWGTQLFYPFSDYRVALNTVFVVDPLYTVPFGICLVVALFLRRTSKARRFWNWLGIGLSCFYLVIATTNKLTAEAYFHNALREQGKSVRNLSTYPTFMNSILWYCVAEEPSGYEMGYHSLLGDPRQIQFRYFRKQRQNLEPYEGNRVVEGLHWLSKEQFVTRRINDTIHWYDLRFGLIDLGPENPDDPMPFSFIYKLIEEDSSIVEIETIRPGTDRMGGEQFQALWEKVKGE
ncbi:MAG: metal-dependent hydrolase [Bacteroidota bacterium]